MRCRQAMDTIHTALDKDRSAPLPRSVLAHLEDCEDCRRDWERLRKLEELVPQMPVREDAGPPESLHAGIMEAVARRGATPGARRSAAVRAVRWWGLAAAVFLGAYLLFHGLDKPSTDRGPGNVANVAPPAIPVKAPRVDPEAVVSAELGSDLLREVVLSGVLSGFADNIPVPSAPNPKVRVPEFPLSEKQWRQTQAIAVASVEIAGTVRGF